MATGGTGDVLAGMVAGLLAQGLAPFDAARAGVAVHGWAGDRAAWRRSQAGMSAGDLAAMVPDTLREVMGR
jgi:NAD(P)H-hydrate epimerase